MTQHQQGQCIVRRQIFAQYPALVSINGDAMHIVHSLPSSLLHHRITDFTLSLTVFCFMHVLRSIGTTAFLKLTVIICVQIVVAANYMFSALTPNATHIHP